MDEEASNTAESLRQQLESMQRALVETEAQCALCEADRKTADMALADTRNKIEQKHQEWMAALDVVKDPIFLHDKEFRILRCNNAYQQHAGVPFKQIIGQPYYEVFPIAHASLHGCLSAIEKNAEEEEVTVGDAIFRSRSYSVHDKQGVYLYSVHILEDITERKQTEKHLTLFRALIDSSSDGIEIIDPVTSRLLDVNETECHQLGYTRKEMLSMSIYDIDPDFKENPDRILEPFRQSGQAMFETVHQRKDGSIFPVEINVKFIELDKPYALSIARDITERKQSEAKMQNVTRALATLSEVNRILIHATHEQELLSEICHAIAGQQGYRMAWVGYLEHDEEKSIRPVASAGFEDGYLKAAGITWADTEHGRGPAGRAARSGHTQVAKDIRTDKSMRLWREDALKRGYVASIALPLVQDGKVFAVLSFYSEQTGSFSQEETKLLEEMTEDMAFGVRILHIRNERDRALKKIKQQFIQLQDNLEDTVKAIASIVEIRDPYTAGHEARVSGLAVAIAREMGLPEEQVHGIKLSGELHDLGKVQVPAEILSKPVKLNESEYSLIKAHPQAGYDILKNINFPWPIAQTVLQHHERVDGSGYPQGLKGEQIILEARILCVADVVEAMHSHRPYRPGLGIESALNEIKKGRDKIYDPVVVDACLKLFQEERFKLKQ